MSFFKSKDGSLVNVANTIALLHCTDKRCKVVEINSTVSYIFLVEQPTKYHLLKEIYDHYNYCDNHKK